MHRSKDGPHRYASETVSTTCSRGYCCQHLYGVNGVQKYIYIYSTKEHCGQISVERACERYLLSLLRF